MGKECATGVALHNLLEEAVKSQILIHFLKFKSFKHYMIRHVTCGDRYIDIQTQTDGQTG